MATFGQWINIHPLFDGQGGPIMLVGKSASPLPPLPCRHLVTPPKEHFELLPIWQEGALFFLSKHIAFFVQIFGISQWNPYHCDPYHLNREDFQTKVKNGQNETNAKITSTSWGTRHAAMGLTNDPWQVWCLRTYKRMATHHTKHIIKRIAFMALNIHEFFNCWSYGPKW